MPRLPSVSELMVGAQIPLVDPKGKLAPVSSATLQRSSIVDTSPRAKPHLPPFVTGRPPFIPTLKLATSIPAALHAPPELVLGHFINNHHGRELFVPYDARAGSVSETRAPLAAPAGSGGACPQYDYFSYAHPRHTLLLLATLLLPLPLLLLLPMLAYGPRHDAVSMAPMGEAIPRLALYQGPRETIQRAVTPNAISPTTAHKPRPASFSHASGNGPSNGVTPATSVASGVSPSAGPAVPGIAGAGAGPLPRPYQPAGPVLVAPTYSFYNGPAAGSVVPFVANAPDAPPLVSPHTLRLSPGGYLPAYSYGAVPYGPVMAHAHPHGERFVLAPAGEVAHTADPNHALVNKRCIIKRRTRTGCLTCRKRRIKCDERKPHCFNCERSKKLCLGYELPSALSKRLMELNAKELETRTLVHSLILSSTS